MDAQELTTPEAELLKLLQHDYRLVLASRRDDRHLDHRRRLIDDLSSPYANARYAVERMRSSRMYTNGALKIAEEILWHAEHLRPTPDEHLIELETTDAKPAEDTPPEPIPTECAAEESAPSRMGTPQLELAPISEPATEETSPASKDWTF